MPEVIFYKCNNCILSVLGSNSSVDVVLALTRANCIPVLTYGIATIPLASSDIRYFTYAYNSIFCKLFKSNDVSVIEQCQYYCSFWPFYALYEYHRYCFLNAQYKSGHLAMNNIFNKPDFIDLQNLISKYNFGPDDPKYLLKDKVWFYW